jgi:type I restriction enzyme S subunit
MAFTAEGGVTDKGERYDRSFLVKSADKLYKRTEFNDFIYSSNNLDVGSIGLNKYGTAVISDVYEIFSINKNGAPDFISELIQRPFTLHNVLKFRQGCLYGQYRIYASDFLSVSVFAPQLEEQKKINNFLSLIDKRIEKQRQLVESLKKYKRGYFQRIISSLETSSFELKNIVDEYNVKSKIQNEFPILSSTLSGIKLQNDYFNKQAASETTIGYKIVPFGYFTYRSMSDTGEFRFNLQNIVEKGIVSPAYPVFKVRKEYNAEFVEYILNATDKIKSQLLVKKEGGTRYALSFSKFQTLKIDLPIKNVQDKMVAQLYCVNKILTNEERILSNLQKLKNGLLQQMFI